MDHERILDLIPDEHDDCIFVPHLEVQNVEFDWWHKDENPGRYFGLFECKDSECNNKWSSAWTWLGRGQKCIKCTEKNDWYSTEYINPHFVKPREKPPGGGDGRPSRNTHYQYCEFCAELCGSTYQIPTHHACKHVVPGDPYQRAYRRNRRRAYSPSSSENSD